MDFTKLEDLDLKGKRVFVRVDFNVPISEGTITDTTRIEASLPTIRYVLEQQGRCVLGSHLGRPKGKAQSKLSLEPVGQKLSELLNQDVMLTETCVGDGPRGLSHQMRDGEVLLLENLRFHPGEEENSSDFSNQLAALCDLYIGDAFGTVHRAHGSTEGLPALLKTHQKAPGFLVRKELEYLEPLRDNPARPFVLIMGGSKVSSKIGVLEHCLDKIDSLLIGGAMAYAFLKAKDIEVGNSFCEDKQVELASKILKGAEARNVQLILPVDHAVTRTLDDKNVKHTDGPEISEDMMGVDIGPKTIEAFRNPIMEAKTIFWNGPMGVFETPEFAKGTFTPAELISQSSAAKLAGGGDSVAAIRQSGKESDFDFMSTGGGATLEFLEGAQLPGLKILEKPRPRF